MPGLKVVFRKGVAYATGTVGGRRVRQSLKTGDGTRAKELCSLLETRLWKRHSYGEEAVRTFQEAALSYIEAGGERRYTRPLIVHFRGRILGTIKPEEIRAAARALGRNKGPATMNRQYIVPARAVINHAAGLGWCAPIEVKSFPVSRPKRVVVDRAWVDAFLDQADRDGVPHLAAALLFMWQTGVRVSEAARVLPEHVDLGQRVILLETTKTDAWEERHITRELVIRIANLPKVDGAPLFGYASRFGIRNRMKAVCRRAGLPFVPPHQAGRHSFATNALALGGTVPEVMKAGGWKTARMMLDTYAHADRAGRTVADRFDHSMTHDALGVPQAIGKKGRK
jgi:integrase